LAADTTSAKRHPSQALGEGERHPELTRMLAHSSIVIEA
jgi:hypothetical protein